MKSDIVLEAPFQPFLSAVANEYFESLLTPDSIVCEYGAGKGTIWLAQRVKRVISIEHDPVWLHSIQQALDERELEAELHLIAPSASCDAKAAGEEYTTFIQRFPDEYFDIIFLDGWRPSRSLAPSYARDKVKSSGWIIVDNLEWHPVHAGVEHAGIESWEVTRFQGPAVGYIPGVSQGPLICHTGFYQRPEVTSDEA